MTTATTFNDICDVAIDEKRNINQMHIGLTALWAKSTMCAHRWSVLLSRRMLLHMLKQRTKKNYVRPVDQAGRSRVSLFNISRYRSDKNNRRRKKKAIKRRESDECLVSQCLIHISIACCMRSDATEENDIENEGNTAKKKKNGRIFYCENSCHSQRSPQRGTTMVYTPHMNGER